MFREFPRAVGAIYSIELGNNADENTTYCVEDGRRSIQASGAVLCICQDPT